MATIVNARDVLLQAASPRVASISMASNLVVSQSQVDGLGLVVAGTKLVWLTATTQVFQIAKSGAVSPASTTLTATVRNLTATPTLTVISGTISPAPTLSSGQATIQYAHLQTDTATIRLTVVESSVTYTDEITIVKVREGIDSLNGFLTNEAHTITADYLGNPLSYTGAGGTFKVFQGINDITTLCTFSLVANPSNLTYSIGATTGVYSVTGGYPVGTDLTTITFRATFGTSTLDKVFTLAKAKAATPSKTLTLSSTSQVFQIAKSGTVTPSSVVFTSSNNNLTGSPSFSTSPNVTLTNISGNNATLTYANMGSNDAVTVTVTQDGVQDQMTIVKVREGTDTITSVLTNEAHTVPSASDGSNVNYAGASTTIVIYEGATDVSNSWAYSTAATNCTVSPTSIAAGTDAKTFTVSAMTADIAYVDITATRSGYPNQVKRFTVSKAKAGVNGTAGQRGSRTFYVALSGSTNTWSDSLATTTAQVDGGVVLNDTVTQYNNSQNFSQTKFWNGSAWVTVNAIVDGNLLVSGTVGATHLSANSVTSTKIEAGAVTADKITVSTLSAIQASLGTVQINASGYLRTSGATAFGTGTGVWIGDDGGTYKLRVGNPSGNRMEWDGTNLKVTGQINVGNFTGYAWPAAGGTGAHLSSSGLLIGNANDGKYFQVDSSGNVFAPQFSINNGSASFSGALSAASGTFAGSLSAATGTFAGTLTAAAVNAVDTVNIAGNAVTIPKSYSTTATLGLGAEQTCATLPTFTSKGGPIALMFGSIVSSTTGAWTVTLRWKRNGTEFAIFTVSDNGHGSVSLPPVQDTPGNGVSVAYTVTAQYNSGDGAPTLGSRGAFCVETIR